MKALRVTDGMLSLLGVQPKLGHLVRKEDDVPGAPDRVILSHGYWQRAFGAARDVVGQSLVIDARPYEIIGVLPASFKLLDTDPRVILPLRLNRANAVTGANFGLRGMARLKPGVTLSQANDDIARMIPLIVEQFPLPSGLTPPMWQEVGLAPNVRPLSEDVIGEISGCGDPARDISTGPPCVMRATDRRIEVAVTRAAKEGGPRSIDAERCRGC